VFTARYVFSCTKSSAARPGRTPGPQYTHWHATSLTYPSCQCQGAQQHSSWASLPVAFLQGSERFPPHHKPKAADAQFSQRLQLTLTARSRVLLRELTVTQLFVDSEGSLPAPGPYPDPDESIQQSPISFNINVSLMLLSIPRST
jgi:hypothetical protein